MLSLIGYLSLPSMDVVSLLQHACRAGIFFSISNNKKYNNHGIKDLLTDYSIYFDIYGLFSEMKIIT